MMPRVFHWVGQMFTGPDGQTLAIGRVSSVPMLVVGLALPVVKLVRHEAVGLEEYGIEATALAGAITMLISGTNHVDLPNGRFLGLGQAGGPTGGNPV